MLHRVSFSTLWTVITIMIMTATPVARAFVPFHLERNHRAAQKNMASDDYLSSLSSPSSSSSSSSLSPSMMMTTPPPLSHSSTQSTDVSAKELFFAHVPLSYFSLDQLRTKGPRANADVGQPWDASRSFYDHDHTAISSGSWWCAAGGWPSPKQRTTTEIFFVLEGHGCLTDLDHTRHYFGPGDTVILPKGWSGRWDIMEAIHKVWFVHEHPNIEDSSQPIRVRVVPYHIASPQHMVHKGVRADATNGTPSTSSKVLYEMGPTEVGFWTCTPGSFPCQSRSTTECFHVLEGVFFLTNSIDGSAQRCQAGDTVVLPKGWSGHWDVIETVKKLWVVV